MTPEECRAYADACCPRVMEDGWTINAQHVAIESSLRRKYGHPSYIAELDGPGRYRPQPVAVPERQPDGTLRLSYRPLADLSEEERRAAWGELWPGVQQAAVAAFRVLTDRWDEVVAAYRALEPILRDLHRAEARRVHTLTRQRRGRRW